MKVNGMTKDRMDTEYADGTVKDGLWENGEWVGKRKSPVLGQKK